MAVNMTLHSTNAQRRGVSVGVYKINDDVVAAESTVGILPKNVLVTGGYVQMTKESSVASSTVDVTINGTTFKTGASATSTTTTAVAVQKYLPTGGDVNIKAGSTAPTNFEGVLVVEYIELDKVVGEYTEVIR